VNHRGCSSRTIAFSLVLVLAFFLSSCGTATSAPAVETVQSEIVGRRGFAINIAELDPSLVLDNNHDIMFNIYETLTIWDAERGVLPKLAVSWERNEEATEWTFHLREGVRFQDGTPFNADAVKFSFERTIEKGALAYIFASFKEIRVVDDLTVKFVLLFPAPLDKIMGDGYGAFMMSPTMADKDAEWFGAGNGIGTGPYVIESYEPGKRLVLTRNDDYWGGWREGQFTKIIYYVVEDPTVMVQMLQGGELDIADQVPFDVYETLEATNELRTFGAPAFVIYQYLIKTTVPPFDDVRVRQALAYSFPYEDIQQTAFGGLGNVAKSAVPSLMWESPIPIHTYQYDLDTARALLDEAGYAEGFEAELMLIAGRDEELRMAEVWQGELAKIGINLKIQQISMTAVWDEIFNPETTYQIHPIPMWPGYTSPSEFICAVFHSEWTFNPFSEYSSAEFNHLCEMATATEAVNETEADNLYAEAIQLLYEDVPAIFVLDMPWSWVYRTDIEGFRVNPLYMDTVFWYDITRK
jgi:peptide/nickel transport system substrate-binding protein